MPELGHVVFYVRDLERSAAFYRDLLGFTEVGRFGSMGMALTGGRTHHEFLLLQVGDAPGPVQGRRIGLYHIGIKVGDSDDELRAMQKKLTDAGITIEGATDHEVTHSLYLSDPDGNEVEVYIDALPPEIWKRHPQKVMATPKPLRL